MGHIFMKRFMILFMALAVIMSGCGMQGENGEDKRKEEARGGSVKILATIFPEYDWAQEILGEGESCGEVELLVDNGEDLHSYQPSVEDIMSIASCDLFIYVGGESDSWVQEVLEQTENPGRREINLMEILGSLAREEEMIEGMEAHEHEEEGEEPEYDEHVWLSLKNAGIFCEAIAGELTDMDPDHGEIYQENAEIYREKLSRLDEKYGEAVKTAGQKVLLFGDRFPFRYLTEDYGISYYAAFAGCSAESEVSFRTVAFLAGQVDRWDLSSILTIKGGDGKIADTIRQNTRSGNQEILVMDSMQSVTSEDIEKGADYLTIMEQNLEALKKALRQTD